MLKNMIKKNNKKAYLKYLCFKNLGICLFRDNLYLFPNILNICPLPQYLLQYFFPPPNNEINNGITKQSRPSHANNIITAFFLIIFFSKYTPPKI